MKKLQINNQWIGFQADKHTYIDNTTGRLLTGTTTILDVRKKEFLMWWTVKLMYEKLLDKQEDIKKATPAEYEAILLEAKKAHTVRSKEAANDGKKAHEIIERIILARINNTDVDVWYNENDKVRNAVNQFLLWEKEHQIEWLASEVIVGSQKDYTAGTIDFLANIDGVFTLGDFKTSNQFGDDVFLQTGNYWKMLDECLDEGVERPKQRMAVRIDKNGGNFEILNIKTDLLFDIETFNRLREIYRWNLYIKNNFCDENGKIKI